MQLQVNQLIKCSSTTNKNCEQIEPNNKKVGQTTVICCNCNFAIFVIFTNFPIPPGKSSKNFLINLDILLFNTIIISII